MYSVRLEHTSVVYLEGVDYIVSGFDRVYSEKHDVVMTSQLNDVTLSLAETSQVFVIVHATSIDCSMGRNEPLQYSVTCAFVNKPHEQK